MVYTESIMDTVATIMLFAHLVGAGALFGLSAWTFTDLWTGRREVLRARAFEIGVLSLVQIGSGSALALASGTESALVYCSKMGLYLTLVVVVEAALYNALARQGFPLRPAFGMAGLALAVMAGTVLAL